MSENLNPTEIEDVEGHRVGPKVDGTEDVEGHRLNVPKIDGADDDVEGHRLNVPKIDGADDDVEGHRLNVPKVDGDDADDVSGHVQPRRDLDIER